MEAHHINFIYVLPRCADGVTFVGPGDVVAIRGNVIASRGDVVAIVAYWMQTRRHHSTMCPVDLDKNFNQRPA